MTSPDDEETRTTPECVASFRRGPPWLFRICVLPDLVVLFVVTGILVALAAALNKAI